MRSQTWRAVRIAAVRVSRLGRDFWEPFEWYLRVEQGLPATYFLIPFKGRAGEHVPGGTEPRGGRRPTTSATSARWPATLERAQAASSACTASTPGTAWSKGRDELARIVRDGRGRTDRHPDALAACRRARLAVLEQAGYSYDSTAGYNETIGYRNGTTQVFRPLGARTLLELPLHIQDGALFYPARLDLSEARCVAPMR